MGNKYRQKKRTSSEFQKFIYETRAHLAESTLNNSQKNSNISKTKMPITDTLLSVIAPYDGKRENNIQFFIEEFDRAATQTEFGNEVKLIILRSKFVGMARERLQSDMELNSETDYVKFKEKAIQTFAVKKTFGESHNEFSKIQQKPAEVMRDYIVRFNLVAAKFFEISGFSSKADAKKLFDLMKLHRFLESIKPDIALEIRKRGIDKYKDATELALTIENAFVSVKHEELNAINTNATTEFCESLLKKNEAQAHELIQLRSELEKLKVREKEKLQDNSRNNTKYCSICNLRNHDTESCRYNVRNKRQYRDNNYQRNFPTHRQNTQGFVNPNNENRNFQGYGSVNNWSSPPPPPQQQMAQNYGFNCFPQGYTASYPNYGYGNYHPNNNYNQNFQNGQMYHQNQGQTPPQEDHRNSNSGNTRNNVTNKPGGRKITGKKPPSGNA